MNRAINEKSELKKVILTFDDGPHPQWTPKILDLLHDYDVNAVFFPLGKNSQFHPSIMQKILNHGHVIGNHTWSHRMILSGGSNLLEKEVLRFHTHVFEHFGYAIRLFRPPWGVLFRKHASSLTERFSYKILLWDIDSMDWAFPWARNLNTRLLTSAVNKPILLMHDGISYSPTRSRSHTIKMLEQILKKKGQSLDFELPLIS